MPRELGRRRISLVLHKFSRGGSDRVAAHLARGFTDRSFDVELLVFCRGGEVETVLTDLVGSDIPIRYFGQSTGVRPLDMLLGLPRLVRSLRCRRPDVVISTANNTALITAIAVRLARLGGARLVLKTTNPIASSRHTGLARRIRLWTYRTIFAWTDAVWTLSPDESHEMCAEFPEFAQLFVDVHNPYVTPVMLAGTAGAVPPGGACKTIICVARLTPQKRLDRLIAAFARVRDRGTRLLILGEGEERATLTTLIEQLGIADRVSMPGYCPDVAAELHAADLFVLTSEYEGLPAALLEAMAANCPALSTDCFPAARSLLRQAEGCAIIERSDPASLAALIETHLTMQRPTTLRAIAAHYSIENGVASHAEALRSVA